MSATEDFVTEALRVIEDVGVRTPGLVCLRALVAIGVEIEVFGVAGIGGFGGLAFLALGGLLVVRLVFGIGVLVSLLRIRLAALRLLLVVALALLLLAIGEFLGKLKVAQHVAHQSAEFDLAGCDFAHAVKRRGGALLDPRAPRINQRLCRCRRLETGELLPHDQRQRVFDRSL